MVDLELDVVVASWVAVVAATLLETLMLFSLMLMVGWSQRTTMLDRLVARLNSLDGTVIPAQFIISFFGFQQLDLLFLVIIDHR